MILQRQHFIIKPKFSEYYYKLIDLIKRSKGNPLTSIIFAFKERTNISVVLKTKG